MVINQEIIIFGVLFCVNLEVHNLTFPKNIKISIFKKFWLDHFISCPTICNTLIKLMHTKKISFNYKKSGYN